MRIRKVLSAIVVGVASLIVLAVAVFATAIFVRSRGDNQQNFAPSQGQHAASPKGDWVVGSELKGNSSLLYKKTTSGREERLTSAEAGIESEPNFSHDGKYVAYSYATSTTAKSSVWIVAIDGSQAHVISSQDQDSMRPVFAPDDSKVFYAVSNFTGNHSPIVRPARHNWDVYVVPVQAGAVVTGSTPTQVTHTSFYDLQSLDVALDGITPTGTKLLISTTGYPIGALIEEFNLGSIGGQKLFQPHVPGESKSGPSYGEALFIHDGMDVVFLAATDSPGANYDYNVYTMSDVTGGELKQLTHLKGMTKDLKVLPDGRVAYENGGTAYAFDFTIGTTKPL